MDSVDIYFTWTQHLWLFLQLFVGKSEKLLYVRGGYQEPSINIFINETDLFPQRGHQATPATPLMASQ